MLIMFSPIFVADTKIICGYNFVAPLTVNSSMIISMFCKEHLFRISALKIYLGVTGSSRDGDPKLLCSSG